MNNRQCSSCGGFCKRSGCERENVKPAREWQGLTDEEILHLEEATTCLGHESWLRNLTRNIEQALKEKNT